MKVGWIVGGWLFAMLAALLPVMWSIVALSQRNPMGLYINDSGLPTWHLVVQFFRWWLPIATPISVLAFACMFLNRPTD
ncbi:MAG: hypothetical protein ABIT16_03020 [Croceibacterium sp.]